MNTMEMESRVIWTRVFWTKKAQKMLVGKKIKSVRYLNDQEAEEMGWDCLPLAIFFDDGSFIYASSDDEGNNGGALFTSDPKEPVLPVMRRIR